jgi:hypothetical protein
MSDLSDNGAPYERASNNKLSMRTIQQDIPAKAESWKYDFAVVIENTGDPQITGDVSLFLPFDTLIFTETGTAQVTVTLRLRPGSRGVLIVDGASGAVDVTGTIDGVESDDITVYTHGTAGAATALGPGTYYLEN